ncbi:MAG: acyclic terpene utilization AtuA family protein [Acidobacteriota bacterium]
MTVLRVANASGFYGDRFDAAREMVEGGAIDVLTGDYLAELTLMILQKDRRADPSLGYAKTFPKQLRGVAATCLDRGIKIVVNAGGLNPRGCADACRAVYAELGLDAEVAHLEGDDLLPRLPELQAAGERFKHLDRGTPLSKLDHTVVSANAYLGAWGIAEALGRGADVVICPRVTDAALVIGPAAWRFGWARDRWDALASALVAGHIVECGAQATGGNYSFFDRVDDLGHPGFPIAEIAADGSFVVTKHPGTGGAVTVGTVTAQLLYEIDGPRYRNPDVTARFDTIRLESDGEDRVRVSGVQGEPPPTTTKVCLNYLGGFKNSVTFLLTGRHLEEKARIIESALFAALGGREDFQEVRTTLHRTAAGPGSGVSESFSFLTVAVKDPDRRKVDRRFSSAAVELALASIPGFNLTAPPGSSRPFGVYWPALIDTAHLDVRLVFDGEEVSIEPTAGVDPESPVASTSPADAHPSDFGDTVPARLGRLVGARSGDKGGNANLGVWAESGDAFRWLDTFLTVDTLRELIPEARDLEVDRHRFPNLRALNFVLRGFLGDGVAASLATDPQAKGLGEFLLAQVVDVPRRWLDA